MPHTKLNAKQVADVEVLLRTVSVIVKKRGREMLADTDITPPQFNALLTLIDAGTLTIGELGERMYLACSTATDLVDRMERNGLVVRERDTDDRRVIRLRVLDKGQQVIDEVIATRRRYLSTVLAELSTDEVEGMITALTHLSELMTQSQVQS